MTTIEKLTNELQTVLQSDINSFQLAEKTGVNYASIHQLRSGKKELTGIRIETAEKLLKAKMFISQ